MNTAGLSIIDAMEAPDGFQPWFEGPSWNPWKAVLKGAFALPMTPQELITFGELAGGRAPPKRRVRWSPSLAGDAGRTPSPQCSWSTRRRLSRITLAVFVLASRRMYR